MFDEYEDGGLSDEDLEHLTVENLQEKIDEYERILDKLKQEKDALSSETKEEALD